MNGADRDRVKELLFQAARLKPEFRRAYIEEAAGFDRAAASEAMDLLPMLDHTGFMSDPTSAGIEVTITSPETNIERPGAAIGRYKLLQKIGEGGFGVVFMAEQTEPVIRRVALKIIKAGMDTRQVIARFEAERQALAMMDHPNIARVLDAGATDSGRPYFVMELVRGDPVTQYCDREQLSVELRLELFRDICGAVQHAHQKGIIHRDIKPSNVLVTIADGRPIPKVIDFGIAKAVSVRLTDKTLFTELHTLIGTPEYMSPEQAEVSGVDIDTRSDIYSLGVLLYELLAGGTPLDARRLRSLPLAEMQRVIRDEEPPRPSLRVRTLGGPSKIAILKPPTPGAPSTKGSAEDIAKRRRTEPVSLVRSLRGDLDWIVMKCLEKDRNRRYATAAALSEDVANYLAQRPVAATPPSVGYTLRKFVRRHRRAVLAGGSIAATLLIATIVSIAFAMQTSRALTAEQRQRKLAEDREEEIRQVAQFQSDLLAGIDVQTMGQGLVELLHDKDVAAGTAQPVDLAKHVLDEFILGNAADAIKERFPAQPQVAAELLNTLGSTYLSLGLFDKAEAALRSALQLQESEKLLDAADTLTHLAGLFSQTGRPAEAEKFHRRALDICLARVGPQNEQTVTCMNNVAATLAAQGDASGAEAMLREALEAARKLPADQQAPLANALNSLGMVLQSKADYAAAEPLLVEALDLQRKLHGNESEDVATSLNNLAGLRYNLNDLAGAEPLFRESLELKRKILGNEHPDIASALNNLAGVLDQLGDRASAMKLYDEALTLSRRLFGDHHPLVANTLSSTSMLVQREGDFTAAEPLLREALAIRREAFGEDHPDVALSLANLASLLRKKGDPAAAEPLFRDALKIYAKKLPTDHPRQIAAQIGLARTLMALNKLDEAEPLLVPLEASQSQTKWPASLQEALHEALAELHDARTTLAPGQNSVERNTEQE